MIPDPQAERRRLQKAKRVLIERVGRRSRHSQLGDTSRDLLAEVTSKLAALDRTTLTQTGETK